MTEPPSIGIELLKLVGAGVAAAVLTQAMVWTREGRKDNAAQQRDSRYLALRLSVILERFAIVCADRIGDNEMHRNSDGHAGSHWVQLPELLPFPADADWKALDTSLAARTLAFTNEIYMGREVLEFAWEVYDPQDLASVLDEEAGFYGSRAWDIARDLRSVNKLPKFVPNAVAYDPLKVLHKFRDRALRRRADGEVA